MSDADNLRRQIERAKRLAASMTSEIERIGFEAMASEFQRKPQLVEARQQQQQLDHAPAAQRSP